jgi:hypothetical protein
MSKFSFFFLATHQQNCNWNYINVGTTNSKPPRPIIMIDQSEILSCSHVQFITLFFGSTQLCCAFYQPWQAALHEFGAEKPISWAKPAHFDFLAINFTLWSHILCTGEEALTGFILGEFPTSEQTLNYFKYVCTWQLDLNKDLILILCHMTGLEPSLAIRGHI